jgi:hypothetical protein
MEVKKRGPGGPQPPIEFAAASRPFAGQTESGDLHVVEGYDAGVLLAVIDGLGHGSEAALAARSCAAALLAHAADPLTALVVRCHERLQTTRGAVLGAVKVERGCLMWIGIGNVEAMVVRSEPGILQPPRMHLRPQDGIVGHLMPKHLQVQSIPVECGDVLILTTDGIRPDFQLAPLPGDRPREIANRILSWYGTGRDDALVLVARLTNSSS